MIPGERSRIALRHVPVNKKSLSAEKLLRRKGYSADGGCAHVTDSVAEVDVKTGMHPIAMKLAQTGLK